jgi:hypothetical protein
MGLFNYIQIDDSIKLPDFPNELDRRLTVFQTKDLDDNAMMHFNITSNGQLEIFKQEGEWVNNSGIKFFGAEFRVDKERWEPYDFTGNILLYESYKHPDDIDPSWEDDNYYRFERGWVEYSAKFLNGKLVEPIKLVNIKPASKRTDEELKQFLEICRIHRDNSLEKLKKQRRDNPTDEQRLIDDIDDLLNDKWAIQTVEDSGRTLNRIREKIEQYREKHDRFYERV